MKRKDFLRSGLALAAGPLLFNKWGNNTPGYQDGLLPEPVRLTHGEGFYWFGYYDKLQTDPSGRYVLCMNTAFEMRPPESGDIIDIGMIDTKRNNRFIKIGTSNAWGWQQGCMLQWLPGSENEVIWNDRIGESYVCHIYNIKTSKKITHSKPVYAISPDGKWAIGTGFNRIQNLRPGYGYAGIKDPYENIKAPEEIGLYRIDLKTGAEKMLFSLADLARIPHKGEGILDNYHWFNHLLVNTDGSRFTFLHRWRKEITDRQKMAGSGFITRMFTANADGSDLFMIDPSGFTSHFVWSDPRHICAWTRPEGENNGFYLIEDKTGRYEPVGKGIMVLNGHNTYVPGTDNSWILCDTYPQGKERLQELYLFHVPTQRKVVLGRFYEPPEYIGEWRCDLHPKCTPDGKKVIIDSTHEGMGRQVYMADISGFIN